MIPTDAPDRIGRRIGVAADSTRAGDLGELVAADDRPFIGYTVPLRERAARDIGLLARERGVFAVVRVDQDALAGIHPFPVIPGQVGPAKGLLHLLVAEELRHRERAHVDLIEPFLHRGVVKFVRRILQVPGVAGRATEHLLVRDHAHVALRVDRIGADEELLRFAVDEAIGRRAADAFRPDDLLQVGRDLVELVRRPARLVRRVGDHPEPVRPRHHRARAALLLLVEHGEMRIDAADLKGRRSGQDTRGSQSKHGPAQESIHQGSKGEWASGKKPSATVDRTPPKINGRLGEPVHFRALGKNDGAKDAGTIRAARTHRALRRGFLPSKRLESPTTASSERGCRPKARPPDARAESAEKHRRRSAPVN